MALASQPRLRIEDLPPELEILLVQSSVLMVHCTVRHSSLGEEGLGGC